MRGWVPGRPSKPTRVLTFDEPAVSTARVCSPTSFCSPTGWQRSGWSTWPTMAPLHDRLGVAAHPHHGAPIQTTGSRRRSARSGHPNGIRFTVGQRRVLHLFGAEAFHAHPRMRPGRPRRSGRARIRPRPDITATNSTLMEAFGIGLLTARADDAIVRMPIHAGAEGAHLGRGGETLRRLVGPSSAAWARGQATRRITYVTTDGGTAIKYHRPGSDGCIRRAGRSGAVRARKAGTMIPAELPVGDWP